MWRSQGKFNAPTIDKSMSHHVRIKAKHSSPLCQSACLVSERNESAASRIVHLFGGACPSAILWRVWTVVVDTVDAIERAFVFLSSIWASPHVLKKCFKRILPSIAYRYAATAVVLPIVVFRITAYLFDSSPRGPFWRICEAVRGFPLPHVSAKTATTFRFASPKQARIDELNSSALTAAFPCAQLRSASLSWRFIKDSKSSEYLSAPVYSSLHFSERYHGMPLLRSV